MPIVYSKDIEIQEEIHSLSFIQDENGLFEVRAYFGEGNYIIVVDNLRITSGVEYIIEPNINVTIKGT